MCCVLLLGLQLPVCELLEYSPERLFRQAELAEFARPVSLRLSVLFFGNPS